MSKAEMAADYAVGSIICAVVLYALAFTLADILPEAQAMEPAPCVCGDKPDCAVGRFDVDGTGDRLVYAVVADKIMICDPLPAHE